MLKGIRNLTFDRVANTSLMAMMGVVVVLSLLDLGYTIVKEVAASSVHLLEVDHLPSLLGLFLWVLISIELLDSVKTYLKEHTFHVETVMSVGLIAVARKVIVLDLHEYEGVTVLGIAAIIAALSVGYYLVRRSHTHREEMKDDPYQIPVKPKTDEVGSKIDGANH